MQQQEIWATTAEMLARAQVTIAPIWLADAYLAYGIAWNQLDAQVAPELEYLSTFQQRIRRSKIADLEIQSRPLIFVLRA